MREQTIICQQCGVKLAIDSRFCPDCSKPVGVTPPKVQPVPKPALVIPAMVVPPPPPPVEEEIEEGTKTLLTSEIDGLPKSWKLILKNTNEQKAHCRRLLCTVQFFIMKP